MSLMKRQTAAYLSLCLLFWVSACSSVPLHTAVPKEEITNARVVGFSDNIRFWADESPPKLGPMIKERIAAYRLANADYYNQHGKYPDLNYLALSGGAYDGAFGAGLLTGWSDAGTRPDFALVTGVSTGALIAPLAFAGEEHNEKLRELYTTANTEAILEGDIWSVIDGVTGGLALTKSAPLAESIRQNITPEIMETIAQRHREGKRLYIGTTNLEAQRGVIWDIGEIANSNHPDALKLIHRILLASASIPGLFEPVFFEVEVNGARYQEIHTDGSITSNVFIYPLKLKRSVIEEFVRSGLDRHLYVIRNSKVTPDFKPIQPGFYSLSRRAIETLTKYHGVGDLYRLYVGARRDGMDYNLVHIPQTFAAQPKEFFDPDYMSKLFDVGYHMGKDPNVWLKAPPGVNYISETLPEQPPEE